MTDHKAVIKSYFLVFGALAVLTVVTVGISYLHLPVAGAVLLGLAIASVKAGLVAAYFMHLKGEKILIYGVLGITVFFMLVLFALPILDVWKIRPSFQTPAAAPVEVHH